MMLTSLPDNIGDIKRFNRINSLLFEEGYGVFLQKAGLFWAEGIDTKVNQETVKKSSGVLLREEVKGK